MVGPAKLQDKAIACLAIAELRARNPERDRRYQEASRRYSEKAVLAKMEELYSRGYLSYGMTVRTAWLTDKGKAALDEARVA